MSPGNVAYTTAGELPCKYVIHAVGPRWQDGEAEEETNNQLFKAVFRSLSLAAKLGKLKTPPRIYSVLKIYTTHLPLLPATRSKVCGSPLPSSPFSSSLPLLLFQPTLN